MKFTDKSLDRNRAKLDEQSFQKSPKSCVTCARSRNNREVDHRNGSEAETAELILVTATADASIMMPQASHHEARF